jgi:hypothetical protein
MASSTENIRKHIIGDMVMITGTFTNGGTDIFYGDHLSSVFACGGHYTTSFSTGVQVDNGSGYALGHTGAMTVKTTDARLMWNIGDTLYSDEDGNGFGARIGIITAIGGATSITCGGGLLRAVTDDEFFFQASPFNRSITLTDTQLNVTVDEVNEYLIIDVGNYGATGTSSGGAGDEGRWWALGKR